MTKYGRVGWDVGVVGRWFRLIMGILILGFVALDFFGGDHSHSTRTNLLILAFFVAFVFLYFGVYHLVVDKLDARPWVATVIFVFPAMYFSAINGFMVPFELSFGYLIGLPFVNHPITIAMVLYIGISFPVQFFSRYGGCEVIAIQNLIYRKKCSSYCVPLLPLDIAEKAIVDRLAKRSGAS